MQTTTTLLIPYNIDTTLHIPPNLPDVNAGYDSTIIITTLQHRYYSAHSIHSTRSWCRQRQHLLDTLQHRYYSTHSISHLLFIPSTLPDLDADDESINYMPYKADVTINTIHSTRSWCRQRQHHCDTLKHRYYSTHSIHSTRSWCRQRHYLVDTLQHIYYCIHSIQSVWSSYRIRQRH